MTPVVVLRFLVFTNLDVGGEEFSSFDVDVIIVGDSKARRIFKDALSILPNLVGPLTAFLYRR